MLNLISLRAAHKGLKNANYITYLWLSAKTATRATSTFSRARCYGLSVLAGILLLTAETVVHAQTSTWNNTSVIFGANSMTTDTLGNSFATGIGEAGYEPDPTDCYTGSFTKTGAVRWVSVFHNFDAAEGLAVAADGQGGVATAGFTYVFSMTSHQVSPVTLAIKYNSAGGMMWSETYQGTNPSGGAQFNAVVQDASGNVYVTGSISNNGTGNDIFTIKYDASTGATDWAQIWDDGAHGSDAGAGIVLDGSGNVYVSGNSGGSYGGVLLKYSATTGALIWAAANPSGGGKSIAVSGNNVYVGGGVVRQFNASTGATGWATPTVAAISQVAVDGAGNLFAVGGNTYPIGSRTVALVTTRLNPADGSVLWQNSYSGNGANGLAVNTAGNVYATSVVNGTNVVAVKYRGSDGILLNSYASPNYRNWTSDFGIGLDGLGDAFILGLTPTPGTNSSESSVLAVGLIGF